MFVVLKLKGEEGPRALDFGRSMPSDVSRVLPSNQGVSLKCPPSGPQKNLLIGMGFLQTAWHVGRLMKIGTRKGFFAFKVML